MRVFGKDAPDSLYVLLCRYIRSKDSFPIVGDPTPFSRMGLVSIKPPASGKESGECYGRAPWGREVASDPLDETEGPMWQQGIDIDSRFRAPTSEPMSSSSSLCTETYRERAAERGSSPFFKSQATHRYVSRSAAS